MGLSVRSLLDGNLPPMRYALSRALGVFIMGMGCFMPPISVIMMCIAVHMVHKGSLTLWDNRARSITLSHPEKRPAPFLCCFIIFCAFSCEEKLKDSRMVDFEYGLSNKTRFGIFN